MATATDADTQGQLAWEAVWRQRGGIAAVLATVLAIATLVYSVNAFADQPASAVISSLQALEQPGSIDDAPSSAVARFEFVEDNALGLIFGSVLLTLGILAGALALWVLLKATAARSERFPRWVRFLPVIGAVVTAVGSLLVPIGNIDLASSFLDTDRTVGSLDDLGQPPLFVAGSLVSSFGAMLLAIAYVVVSLNAMRSGLLPKSWGIVGIAAGAALIIPIGLSQLLQPIWFVAVALILLGRYPGAPLPAWESGESAPWPSAADEAQRRREEREAKKRGGAPPARPDPEPVEERAASSTPHPSSKKRKRKKRG